MLMSVYWRTYRHLTHDSQCGDLSHVHTALPDAEQSGDASDSLKSLSAVDAQIMLRQSFIPGGAFSKQNKASTSLRSTLL